MITEPASTSRRRIRACPVDRSADRRIRAFLAGESQGEDVLNALYGAAFDEPVPHRLRDLLKR